MSDIELQEELTQSWQPVPAWVADALTRGILRLTHIGWVSSQSKTMALIESDISGGWHAFNGDVDNNKYYLRIRVGAGRYGLAEAIDYSGGRSKIDYYVFERIVP